MRRRYNRPIENESVFYCVVCGRRGIPITRRRGAERDAGHLKKIFCLQCQKEHNHVECKYFSHYDYEDFLLEKEYNNFDENGNRKMKYGELRRLIHDGKI